MKLQKVELLGFKSFADKTEIAFNGDGIAAIVGPNGCGKSNISDAIHWVLGEQSPRTLRSGRMHDVIFNGTPGRKATGLAEVRLTMFDPETAGHSLAVTAEPGNNGNGVASRFVEASNGLVTVARRLFASGESEYLLNDRPCRLRDIHELFLGTGLGPDSYAIIEQGRIGQILSAKPYERRSLIEEAAGITKFKAKRKLAWAKLEFSKQNLARVNDILEEVTRQLHSLQRQAARARRYKDLREQLQAQLRTVLISRHRQKEEEATQTALELGLLRSSVQDQSAQIEQQDVALHELQQLLERQQNELRQAAEERGALRLEAEQLRGQIATQSQQAVYIVRRIEEARAEQTQLATRLSGLDAERAECARLAEQLESERKSLSEEAHEWETRLKSCQQGLEEKERRREQLREGMLETVGEAGTLRNQVAQLEQFLSLTARQLAQAESLRSELEAAQESASVRRQQTESRLAEQRAERDQVSARRRELDESLRTAKAEESRYREELEELRTELAAQRARLSSLEEILARHAYSSETIQRLFEARDGNGSAETPSNFQAVGVLADFLEVEPAYERVTEEFLREELDYVVVKDWSSAQQGLHLLQSEVPGRATFLLHTTPVSNGNGSRNEQALPGTLRSLASCVRFTNGFSGGPGPLLPKLERCYLVADADTGRSLALRHPELYFLTPGGIWFQGALVSAGKANHQGPLGLKRELRSLTRALEDHKQVTGEMVETLASTLRQIDEQQVELQSLVQREQDCEKRLAMTERDVQEAVAERDRLAERLALLGLEIEGFNGEADRARSQWANDTWEIAQRDRRKAEMEQETAAILVAIGQLKTERESSQARESELRGKLAGLEERQRSASSTLARLEQAIEELVGRAADLEGQCQQWAQQQLEWEEEKQHLEHQVAAAEQRTEELAQRVAQLETSSTSGRQQQAAQEQELHQLRLALEETREKKSAVEVQLALLQSEMEHLRETCRNELQTELESLAASEIAAEIQALSPEELAQAEELYRQLKTKLENLGPINMIALEEFEQCRERHEFLSHQQKDLLDSIRDTTQAIMEIDTICQQQFTEAFEQIGAHFQRTFTQLFGGGQGMLRLMEAEESSEAGIEIIAQPPGKRLQSVLLLSGGEKALAALALLLAIFHYKPSPFCILDEVDAPLDESNIGRFTQMVEQMSRNTQFILITHSKKTMSIAPVMYGVTMQEPGVSKIVSVRFSGAAGESAAAAPGAAQPLAEAVA
ncbi:MAG: chromosome segregation protein SMC [Acidobacteria bacterium]|nr:chromosome segregation protein SMC [Acidobacteriota bacterium]